MLEFSVPARSKGKECEGAEHPSRIMNLAELGHPCLQNDVPLRRLGCILAVRKLQKAVLAGNVVVAVLNIQNTVAHQLSFLP